MSQPMDRLCEAATALAASVRQRVASHIYEDLTDEVVAAVAAVRAAPVDCAHAALLTTTTPSLGVCAACGKVLPSTAPATCAFHPDLPRGHQYGRRPSVGAAPEAPSRYAGVCYECREPLAGDRVYCNACAGLAPPSSAPQRGKAGEVMSDPTCVYVAEGWWHPNVKSGQVHDHPEHPNGAWSTASHRLCEPVYTRRPAPPSPVPASTAWSGAPQVGAEIEYEIEYEIGRLLSALTATFTEIGVLRYVTDLADKAERLAGGPPAPPSVGAAPEAPSDASAATERRDVLGYRDRVLALLAAQRDAVTDASARRALRAAYEAVWYLSAFDEPFLPSRSAVGEPEAPPSTPAPSPTTAHPVPQPMENDMSEPTHKTLYHDIEDGGCRMALAHGVNATNTCPICHPTPTTEPSAGGSTGG